MNGLDPYLYVLDNPVSLADPSGLKPKYGWLGGHLDIPNTGCPDLLGPLKDMAREALEWYVGKAETAPAWLKPAYWIGGGLCALMTPENAWATETVLTLGLSWRWMTGAVGSQTGKAGVCPAGANPAYEAARAGGTHAGALSNYAGRPVSEIQKAIASYERQVALHLDKLANPARYIASWGQMTPCAGRSLQEVDDGCYPQPGTGRRHAWSARIEVNMTDKYKCYLFDLGCLVRERALDARLTRDRSPVGSPEREFDSGRILAFNEVISIMQQQAEGFDIRLSDLSLDDIVPDRDLV